jgi:hypothetical protein
VSTAHQIRTRLAGCPVVHEDVRVDLASDLRDAVMTRARPRAHSAPSLNVGGWKSSEGFFAWGDAAVVALHEAIRSILERPLEVAGWAMVNRRGSHHPRHRHIGSIVSGIYYVDPGELQSSPTTFELGDGSEVAVDPRPGRLVLFPGDLWHRVDPYAGERARITIAFDVRR